MTHNIGDPDHIGTHNSLVTAVSDLARAMRVEGVVLPPERSLGDTGHVDDHNLVAAAIAKITEEANPGPQPAAIGATNGTCMKSSFIGNGTIGLDGQAYDVYEFRSSGTMQVTGDEGGFAHMLLVGGGAGAGSYMCAGAGGAGWVIDTPYAFLTPGEVTITVGAGGTYNSGPGGAGGKGGNTQVTGGGQNMHTGVSGGGNSYNWGDGGNAYGSNGVCVGGKGTTQGHKLGRNELGGGGDLVAGGGGAGGHPSGNRGGYGVASTVTGTSIKYGGGGGAGTNGGSGTPGVDGGGDGGNQNGGTPLAPTAGAANRGGGGGSRGWGDGWDSQPGGSGVVVFRVAVDSPSYSLRDAADPGRTAHAAKIVDGEVERVIVIPHLDDDDQKITAWCNSIGLDGTWIDTSYLGARRGQYAGVGDKFDTTTRASGEFVPSDPLTDPVALAEIAALTTEAIDE